MLKSVVLDASFSFFFFFPPILEILVEFEARGNALYYIASHPGMCIIALCIRHFLTKGV